MVHRPIKIRNEDGSKEENRKEWHIDQVTVKTKDGAHKETSSKLGDQDYRQGD